MTRPRRTFARYAWGTLAFTVLVILWGGFVRASGSGAGCGDHWPLCNGEVLPRSAGTATLIELTHRLTSGLSLLLVLGLLLGAYRVFGKGHRVRKAAVWSAVFIVVEALVGAGLVLLELVAYNVSVARGYWMAGHLANTFLLLAALAMTAWFASGRPAVRLRGQGGLGLLLTSTLVGMLVIGVSGAVAALGDTLTFGGGVSPEESPVVATLVGLRIYHPLIACFVVVLVAVSIWRAWSQSVGRWLGLLGYALAALFTVQLALGLVNVWLQAPVGLQLLHLFLADLLWIALVLFSAEALTAAPRPEPVPYAPSLPAAPQADAGYDQVSERGAEGDGRESHLHAQ